MTTKMTRKMMMVATNKTATAKGGKIMSKKMINNKRMVKKVMSKKERRKMDILFKKQAEVKEVAPIKWENDLRIVLSWVMKTRWLAPDKQYLTDVVSAACHLRLYKVAYWPGQLLDNILTNERRREIRKFLNRHNAPEKSAFDRKLKADLRARNMPKMRAPIFVGRKYRDCAEIIEECKKNEEKRRAIARHKAAQTAKVTAAWKRIKSGNYQPDDMVHIVRRWLKTLMRKGNPIAHELFEGRNMTTCIEDYIQEVNVYILENKDCTLVEVYKHLSKILYSNNRKTKYDQYRLVYVENVPQYKASERLISNFDITISEFVNIKDFRHMAQSAAAECENKSMFIDTVSTFIETNCSFLKEKEKDILIKYVLLSQAGYTQKQTGIILGYKNGSVISKILRKCKEFARDNN